LNAVGTCGTSCPTKVDCNVTVQNATAICNSGACDYTGSCNAGFGDCDPTRSNGCEVNLNLPTSCGTTCFNKVDCTTSAQNANTFGCTAGTGTCTYTCNSGFQHCTGPVNNGCTTPINTVTDCGGCGIMCNTALLPNPQTCAQSGCGGTVGIFSCVTPTLATG